jgi:tetratricopeptide (TPR) repeat protein
MQKKLIDKGLKFLEAGKLSEARIVLSTLVSRYPHNAEGFHLLAITAMQDGNLDEAQYLVMNSIEKSPNVSYYYNTLAGIELKRDNLELAEQAFLDAIRLEPEQLEYRYNIATFYNSSNRANLAIEQYQHILTLPTNKDNYNAHKGLTLTYFFENQLEEAVVAAKDWYNSHQNSDEPLYYHGLCLHGLNKVKAALTIYDQALKINPYNDQVLTAVAVAFKDLNNLALAEINLNRALLIDDDNPNSLYQLGLIEYIKGNVNEAKNLFNHAINIDDQFAEPIYGLGLIESFEHNHERALHYYTIAHQLDQHLFEAQKAIATTLLKVANFQEGWEYYNLTLEHEIQRENLKETCPEVFELAEWDNDNQCDNLLVWLDADPTEEILFASMLEDLLKTSTQTLVVQASQKIHALLSRSFPNIRFIIEVTPKILSKYAIKQQTSLTALGKYLRQTMADFKLQSHYLEVDAMEFDIIKQRYAELFANKIKVGIIWKDNHLRLSDEELDILRHDNIQLISLQTGPSLQLKDVFIDEHVNGAIEYDKLAAQIKALDFVVALDTSSVHLAGALGVNTHILLEQNANWYWFLNRHTSPWYSSAILHQKDTDNSFKKALLKIQKLINTK